MHAINVEQAAPAAAASPMLQATTSRHPQPVAIGPDAAPLWRVTAAVDPNTTPLELMPVWAVCIDPRKSENFMRFSRSIARRLRTAEQGGDGDGRAMMGSHNENGKTGQNGYRNGDRLDDEENGDRHDDEEDDELVGDEDDDDDDSDGSYDEDESMKHLRLFRRIDEGRALNALVCRVQDLPTREDVIALLKTADLVADGTEPEPFEVQVPRYPAPSRNRLHEWKAFWPVSIKYGRVVHALVQPSLSGTNQNVPCSAAPGVVDRAADALMWNGVAKAWAIANFRKCLRMAWQAQKQGELPIGVHVTSSYPEGDRILSGVSETQTSIEVDAWDTRRSERNPIKHAVTNAIRDVAKVRSERDWERLLVLNAKVANLHRDPHADPDVHRQAMQKAEAAAARANNSLSALPPNGTPPNRMSNGQDYLLNNLILFTTHEPCVSCCMALVHSRVRAVFFIQPSPGAGGCCGSGLEESRQCAYAQDGGPYAVQEQTGLNHRFDVWRWVGDDAEILQQEEDTEADAAPVGEIRLDILGLDV